MASILIIDSDDRGCKAMAGTLRAAGHDVRVAADGRQGVVAFASRRADVVICELLLPQMDGFEVVEHLRRSAPGLPIVATTGGSTVCLPDRLLAVAKANGVSATLRKPFGDDELLTALSEALFDGTETPLFRVESGLLAPPPRPLPADSGPSLPRGKPRYLTPGPD